MDCPFSNVSSHAKKKVDADRPCRVYRQQKKLYCFPSLHTQLEIHQEMEPNSPLHAQLPVPLVCHELVCAHRKWLIFLVSFNKCVAVSQKMLLLNVFPALTRLPNRVKYPILG